MLRKSWDNGPIVRDKFLVLTCVFRGFEGGAKGYKEINAVRIWRSSFFTCAIYIATCQNDGLERCCQKVHVILDLRRLRVWPKKALEKCIGIRSICISRWCLQQVNEHHLWSIWIFGLFVANASVSPYQRKRRGTSLFFTKLCTMREVNTGIAAILGPSTSKTSTLSWHIN